METNHIMYATERLLDSVWTLEYRVVDEEKKQIEIVSFSRDNPIGYQNEKILPRMGMIETDSRIVTGVYLLEKKGSAYWANSKNHDVQYEVVNPKHIFSY